MESSYNVKSPAVKRLMREAKELSCPTEEYYAYPLDENLFEWHFTIRGQPGTEFDGGLYHGRILLPSTYPMQPPYIIFMTPNGRFEVNKKICLSISGHHPETWQPSWSIRTALLALIAFMPTSGKGTIGSLDYSADERKVLAEKSLEWVCPECRTTNKKFSDLMTGKVVQDDEAPETESNVLTEDNVLTPVNGIVQSIQEQSEFEHQNVEVPVIYETSQFHMFIVIIVIVIAALLYRRLSRFIEIE